MTAPRNGALSNPEKSANFQRQRLAQGTLQILLDEVWKLATEFHSCGPSTHHHEVQQLSHLELQDWNDIDMHSECGPIGGQSGSRRRPYKKTRDFKWIFRLNISWRCSCGIMRLVWFHIVCSLPILASIKSWHCSNKGCHVLLCNCIFVGIPTLLISPLALATSARSIMSNISCWSYFAAVEALISLMANTCK